MIKKHVEAAGDFVILREQGIAHKTIVLEGVINHDYIGFSFYEAGSSIVLNIHDKKIGEKQSMRWSSFFVSAWHGNIFREISRGTRLSQLTILYPIAFVKRRFEKHLNTNAPFHQLIAPSDIYVDLKQRVATLDIIQPALKILNCSIITSERELFLESQCLEILSQISNQLKLEQRKINLSIKDIEKLTHAKELLVTDLQSTPSLSKLSLLTGLNTYMLKEGFKIAFGAPPYKWLQEFRLSLAHSKLQTKEYTVSEVAYSVGYSSVNSFNNIFYKRFGIRPGQLIKATS